MISPNDVKPEDIRIGVWYSTCCYLDLYQIATREEVVTMLEILQECRDNDEIESFPTLFETAEEGLKHLVDHTTPPEDLVWIKERFGWEPEFTKPLDNCLHAGAA